MKPLNAAISVLLLTTVLAGCLAGDTEPTDGDPNKAAEALAPLLFESDILIEDNWVATEPSVFQAPDGTIWVAGPTGFATPVMRGDPVPYTHDSGLWSSKDNGKTWAWNEMIPMYGRDLCPGGGDSDIVASPDGTLFLIDLWLGNVDITVSQDGGKTWLCNPYAFHYPGDDRQWIDVYKDEAVYIQVNHLATGSLVVKAERRGDPADGLVFTQQVQAPVGGMLAVDQKDGTVYISGGSNIGVSTDGGKTFASKKTNLPGGVDMDSVAVDDNGTVFAFVSNGTAGLLTYSTDHGKTFSKPPLVVRPYAGKYRFPWVAAHGNGEVSMVWYGSPDPAINGTVDGSYYVFAAQLKNATSQHGPNATYRWALVTPNKPVLDMDPCTGLGCGPGRALGDFFEVGVDKNGMMLIPYNDAVSTGKNTLKFARQLPDAMETGSPTSTHAHG